MNEANELAITDVYFDNFPPYAILSHTWGDGEINLKDVRNGTWVQKTAASKMRFCIQQVRKDGLQYFWIDSCCINQKDVEELKRSLNSMFEWYKGASECYAYLEDVTSQSWESEFRTCRWFTRGWTLQELIAPRTVKFFTVDGSSIGTKATMATIIDEVTGIPQEVLCGGKLSSYPLEVRLAWIGKRETKRIEDQIYCLMGILATYIDPVYGFPISALRSKFRQALTQTWGEQIGTQFLPLPTDAAADDVAIRIDTQREHDAQNVRGLLLNSLKFDQMGTRQRTIKAPLSKTCLWVKSQPEYKSWRDLTAAADDHGMLWICGKPGAGKSTLMKSIMKSMNRSKSAQTIVTSFFYNARGGDLEKSTIGMYRSLLHQLLTHAPDLQYLLDDCGVSHSDPIWTMEHMEYVFDEVIEKLGKRHWRCFIDALDECDVTQVRAMVNHFERLGGTAVELGTKFSTCFASRHYPNIATRHGSKFILERQIGHSEDIIKYIDDRLLGHFGSEIEAIKSKLLHKANGVFLWVQLVLDIIMPDIENGNTYEVNHDVLEKIPNEIGQVIKQILLRDNANMDSLLLSLQWILFTRRPLTAVEFFFAIYSQPGTNREFPFRWDSKHITKETIKKSIVIYSKGLAELTKAKVPTVQFIHETVRDYLLRKKGMQEIWPNLGNDVERASHEMLKQCCHNYMGFANHSGVSSAIHLNTAILKSADFKTGFPFLQYSCQYVLHHANQAMPEFDQTIFIGAFPFKYWMEIVNEFEDNKIRLYRSGVPEYVLADRGLAQLLRILDRQKRLTHQVVGSLDLNPKYTERYQYAVVAALVNGDPDTVHTFLPHVDMDELKHFLARVKVSRGSKVEFCPVEWALRDGHYTVARWFLVSEHYREHDLYPEDIFRLAVRAGREDVVRKSFERFPGIKPRDMNSSIRNPRSLTESQQNWDSEEERNDWIRNFAQCPDMKLGPNEGGGNTTPLQYAVQQDDLAVVNAMMQQGSDLLALHANSAIIDAASAGHLEITQRIYDYILRCRRTGNRSCQEFGSHTELRGEVDALVSASGAGHCHIIKYLLKKGTPVNGVGYSIQTTALNLACHYNRLEAVKILVAEGADLNVTGVGGIPILASVVYAGHTLVAQHLLDQGADIDGGSHHSALKTATRKGDVEMVKFLLHRGATIHFTVPDMNQSTELYMAAEHCHLEIIEIYVEKGARPYINQIAGPYGTVLVAALRSTNEQAKLDVVKYLLEQGANPNLSTRVLKAPGDCSESGVMPLSWAKLYGPTEVENLLRQYGAREHGGG